MTLTLLSSCDVWVPLCMDDHPHLTTLNVVYDWQGFDDAHRPDSMIILGERIVQRWNTTYQVNTGTYNGQYLINDPADEIQPNAAAAAKANSAANGGEGDLTTKAGGTTAVYDHATLDVKQGEYVFFTYSSDSGLFDTSSIDAYAMDENAVLEETDLSIRYIPYDLKEVNPRWTDFNPYTKYVESDANPFMYYMTEPIQCNKDAEQWITLYPHSIMQHITVNLDVVKIMPSTQKFAVDSIFADISGIPYRFHILTEDMDISKTYKMMLLPNYYTATKHTNYTDTYSNTDLRYSSSFYATSLLHPASPDDAMGPGIFQVKIYVHMQDYPDARVSPVYTKINLYDSIVDNPLMEVNEDGTGGKRIGDERVINITKRVTIDINDLQFAGEGDDINWTNTDDETLLDI